MTFAEIKQAISELWSEELETIQQIEDEGERRGVEVEEQAAELRGLYRPLSVRWKL